MRRWLKLRRVNGSVAAPPSKSVAQRILALSLLARGSLRLQNPGCADDVSAARGIISALGAEVQDGENGELVIHSTGQLTGDRRVDCGESGLAMRMFAPLSALAAAPVTLTARGGLCRRPMDMLRVLEHFGVNVQLNASCAPVTVTGPLQAGEVRVDGRRSSQLISGLIMALSQCRGDSCLDFDGGPPVSWPYLELTVQCMERFSLHADLSSVRCRIPGDQRGVMPGCLSVDGDWSGAAFWLVAGAIAGPVTVTGLQDRSCQADRAVCAALAASGAELQWRGDALTVEPAKLRSFRFDATDCPDLFPPLAVLAAASPGRSQIKGVSRLFIKECDRAAALLDMLTSLGGSAGFDAAADSLWIEGGLPLHRALVSSRGDHRMVMSAALLSLLSPGGVEIDDASCVSKSYPEFFADFGRMGGEL